MIHGNVYSYDNFTYTKSNVKSYITCKHHGDFLQSPNKHLNGRGCPSCHRENSRSNQSDIVMKLAEVSPYYELIYYNGKATEKSTFYCHKHNKSFQQTASAILRGKSSCPVCDSVNRSENCSKPTVMTSDFVSRSEKVHDYTYTYENCVFRGWNEKVEITCPIHGPFNQSPRSHLYDSCGCPECGYLRGGRFRNYNSLDSEDYNRDCILYHVRWIREDGSTFDKIGITMISIKQRLCAYPKDTLKYYIVGYVHTCLGKGMEEEYRVLSYLKENGNKYRVKDLKGTSVGGWTECFESVDFVFDSFLIK